MICLPRHAVRTTLASNRLGWVEKEITRKIDARPGGPAAKRQSSPERAGINPEDDLPATACRANDACEQPAWLGRERNNAAKIDARPGGPAAKRQSSPERAGINPEDDLPATACRANDACEQPAWLGRERNNAAKSTRGPEGRPPNVSPVQKELGSIKKMICLPRHAVRTTVASNRLGWVEKEITRKIDARPGGPAAKRQSSPERAGINPEDDLPATACRANDACEQPAWLGRERNNAAKSTRGPEGRPPNVSPVQKGLGSIPKMICPPRHAVRTTLASNRLGWVEKEITLQNRREARRAGRQTSAQSRKGWDQSRR